MTGAAHLNCAKYNAELCEHDPAGCKEGRLTLLAKIEVEKIILDQMLQEAWVDHYIVRLEAALGGRDITPTARMEAI